MAKSDIEQRMEALRGTAPAYLLAEFFKDRLDKRTKEFTSVTKDTFDAHKGRCQELQSLIDFIEKKG